MSKAPREFWISDVKKLGPVDLSEHLFIATDIKPNGTQTSTMTHVIERSAYDELKAQKQEWCSIHCHGYVEQLEKDNENLKQKADKLAEALEYYANKDNWKPCEQYKPWNNYSVIKNDIDENSVDKSSNKVYCGKHAKQALKEYRGKDE